MNDYDLATDTYLAYSVSASFTMSARLYFTNRCSFFLFYLRAKYYDMGLIPGLRLEKLLNTSSNRCHFLRDRTAPYLAGFQVLPLKYLLF
jgi:hypothetical protein